MRSGTFKTTVVLVATSDGTSVYRSAEEVPATVRKRIAATARKGGSATIVIADRAGRRQILRGLRGLPSSVKLKSAVRARRSWRLRLRLEAADAIDVALLGLAGMFLWVAALL